MEGRQRGSFTDDYKRQAVDLVASSGGSVGSVAKETWPARRWVQLGSTLPSRLAIPARHARRLKDF
jgi:hypothetical protein